MAQQANSANDVREQLLREMTGKAEEQNKTRSGKGLRLKVGQTRGKNPQVITWEQFDVSQPDTLPSNPAEFISMVQPSDSELMEYLLDGFNASAYSAASDPIAEFVEPTWDKDTVTRFRLVIRNYAQATGESLEDAVSLMKPGFTKAEEKRKAAASAPAA